MKMNDSRCYYLNFGEIYFCMHFEQMLFSVSAQTVIILTTENPV